MLSVFEYALRKQQREQLRPKRNPKIQIKKQCKMWTAPLCVLLCACLGAAEAQIAYTGHLSELRIKELSELAMRMEHSINAQKYACDSYYDHVCSRNRPLFSVMGGYEHK